MTNKEIAWDLSEVFPSVTHPSVQKAIDNITEIAERLAEKYHGKIKSLSTEELLKCIEKFEAYYSKLDEIYLFAASSYWANMTLSETQLLYDRVNKMEAKLSKMLAFFELEVGKLVYEKPEVVSEPVLGIYEHALEKLRRAVPHQLSEVEEQLIIEKDQFGVEAWQQLQRKWLNTRMFDIEVEGGKKTLPYGEADGLLSHPNRATRASANKSIYGLLGKDGEIFSSALRNICSDWLNICERRKYDSPTHASLISNDIDQETIDNLLKAIETHTHLYQRYLKLKAEIMGLPRLGCHDIAAPLPDAHETSFDYGKAKTLVINAFSKFDDDYAYAVRDMFARNHIDASPRFGKRNGAGCAGWINGKSSFVLCSFNGRLDDVYTLAHELGHATHDYYMERNQTILNLEISLLVAETASKFGELLLTDLLISKSQSDNEKKTILCKALDAAGITIFQVTARAWFEQSLYDAIKRGEYLNYKTICKYWVAARNKIYGNSVEWFPEMEAEWTMKQHYYRSNFRFYNYPYVYAQMLVFALYQKYLEESDEFVPKFKKILSCGSSISPVEICKIAGLNITSPDFWKLGMKQYEHFIVELDRIVKK
ncbi:MAG: M3 family oligoendopeptidase [Candidatus Bathyarchaeota archaeon]|nr:MAG: M3 family oligoendopeptidase [Candidatus Bathyarchaeota archaeon]